MAEDETHSNRSSVLFERSHTHRNLKKENNSFEYSGQKYLIDLDDVGSPASREIVYQNSEPKSMPNNKSAFSSVLTQQNNMESFQNHQIQNDVSTDRNCVEQDLNQTEINDPITQQPIQRESIALRKNQIYQNKILKMEFGMQVNEQELEIQGKKQSEKIVQEEIKIQLDVPEVDNFYADIARQLAEEIEREEAEAAEEEERKRKLNEQKEIQTNQQVNHMKNKSEQIDKNLFKNTLLKPSDNSQDPPPTFKKSANIGNIDISGRDSIQKAATDNPQFRRYLSMGDSSKDFRYDRFARLQQVNSEKALLIEQLQQAHQQLETLNSHYVGGNRNISEAQLHLAFLFASPLVIKQGGQKGSNSKDNMSTVPLLEFTKEFQEIKQSIRETKRNIKVKAKQATIENLNLILSQNPLALHFSGHGIENNKENFGRQYKQRMNEGNYLLFETDEGEGELVSEKMLQELIQQSNTNLEFVFVASCYSEFAGKIFLNAGAKHVVCVKSGQQIADLAVITFANCFYNSVFCQTMTICDAFKMAQKQVQVKYGIGESNKFSLLKQSDLKQPLNNTPKPRLPPGMPDIFDDEEFNLGGFTNNSAGKIEEHKCKVFGPLKQGELEYLEPIPRFQEFPAKVDNFIGRQKEIYEVVHNIYNHRLVTIIGMPGIGKTSLSKNAVHYIADRKLFKMGIVFMQLKGFMNFELLIKKLVVNFIMQNFMLDENEQKKVRESNAEILLQMLMKFLRSSEDSVLLVFDNVEDLLYYDKKAFSIWVNDMLVSCPKIHLLMTSRTTLGALQDISEKILVLQELSPFFTVELFMSRSRDIPEEEIKELIECVPENYILVGDIKKGKNKKVTNLAEHHLFQILGGNPHAIILAAPLLIKMKIKELYLLLNTKEMHEILQVDGIKDSTVASLRLSLEASIKVLQAEDKEALQFFFFIGMLPGGVQEDELNEIWGQDCKALIEKLLNFSLLSKKEYPNESIKYLLPPFMNNYAEAKISPDDKLMFHLDICHYYSKKCKNILDTNGKSYKQKTRQSELNHQIMEKLLRHETNIWACIYRMVDSSGQLPIPDDLIDNKALEKEVNQRIRRFSTLIKEVNSSTFERQSTQIIINDMGQTSPLKNETLKIGSKNRKKTFSDFPDSRPFEVMSSQTPRVQDNKGSFQFSDESKPSQSVLIPYQTIAEKEEQSDISSDFEEDESVDGENTPCDSPNKKIKNIQNQMNISLNNSGQKSFNPPDSSKLEKSSEKEQKLDHIIRNSKVNFYRPSFQEGKLLPMIKSPDIELKALQRRQTLIPRTDIPVQDLQNQRHLSSFRRQRQRVEELHSAEKLIIYYVMNLFLLRENDDALHMITNYALKANGSELYEANLYRILGLIWHHKVEIEKSIEALKKAKQLYSQRGSTYGVALCKFSIGYIYRSKIAEFITKSNEEHIYMKSKANFESSLSVFKEMNHIVGQALCHCSLSMIHLKLKNKLESTENSKEYLKLMRQFSSYKGKKKCPYVQRVHGPEVSLMVEIVTDNETRDMFPPVPQGLSKKKSQSVFQKQYSGLQVQQIQHQSSVPVEISPLDRNLNLLSEESQTFETATLNKTQSLSSPSLSQNLGSENYQISPQQDLELIRVQPMSPGLVANLSTDISVDNDITTLLKQKSLTNNPNKLIKMISHLEVVEEEDIDIMNETSINASLNSIRTDAKDTDMSDQFAATQKISVKKPIKQIGPMILLKRKKSPTSRNEKGLLEVGEKTKMLNKLNRSAQKMTVSKSPQRH